MLRRLGRYRAVSSLVYVPALSRSLLSRAVVAGNKKWQAELEMMVETRQKAEIQALSTFGFQYLTQQYLPQKLVRTTLLLLT